MCFSVHICVRQTDMGLFSLEKKRLWENLKGADKKKREGLFSYSDRTREGGFKLTESKFRWDVQKEFFPQRMVKHWNRLPRQVVAAPSLEVFKARSDGALSNLIQWVTSLPMTGGWSEIILKVPSSPCHSDFMITFFAKTNLVSFHLHYEIPCKLDTVGFSCFSSKERALRLLSISVNKHWMLSLWNISPSQKGGHSFFCVVYNEWPWSWWSYFHGNRKSHCESI